MSFDGYYRPMSSAPSPTPVSQPEARSRSPSPCPPVSPSAMTNRPTEPQNEDQMGEAPRTNSDVSSLSLSILELSPQHKRTLRYILAILTLAVMIVSGAQAFLVQLSR